MPPSFTRDSVVRRTDEQVHCALEGHVVIMTLADGKYFELNPVAARIWDELAAPIRVTDLEARLLADYNVDPATCHTEVNAWLVEMAKHGLVDRGGLVDHPSLD